MTLVSLIVSLLFDHMNRQWLYVCNQIEKRHKACLDESQRENEVSKNELWSRCDWLKEYRRQFYLNVFAFSWRITLLIICILLPINSILTNYAKTYDDTYIWRLSATLMRGKVAVSVLMVSFIIFAMYGLYALRTKIMSPAIAVKRQLEKLGPINYRVGRLTRRYLPWSICFIVNFAVMVTADSVYVYILLNYTGPIVTCVKSVWQLQRFFGMKSLY
jgi:hypothetical protein